MPNPAAQKVTLALTGSHKFGVISQRLVLVTEGTKWPVWLMLIGSRNPCSEVKSTYKQGPLAEWIF